MINRSHLEKISCAWLCCKRRFWARRQSSQGWLCCSQLALDPFHSLITRQFRVCKCPKPVCQEAVKSDPLGSHCELTFLKGQNCTVDFHAPEHFSWIKNPFLQCTTAMNSCLSGSLCVQESWEGKQNQNPRRASCWQHWAESRACCPDGASRLHSFRVRVSGDPCPARASPFLLCTILLTLHAAEIKIKLSYKLHFFPVNYFCSKNSCYINPSWSLKRSHVISKNSILILITE